MLIVHRSPEEGKTDWQGKTSFGFRSSVSVFCPWADLEPPFVPKNVAQSNYSLEKVYGGLVDSLEKV